MDLSPPARAKCAMLYQPSSLREEGPGMYAAGGREKSPGTQEGLHSPTENPLAQGTTTLSSKLEKHHDWPRKKLWKGRKKCVFYKGSCAFMSL